MDRISLYQRPCFPFHPHLPHQDKDALPWPYLFFIIFHFCDFLDSGRYSIAHICHFPVWFAFQSRMRVSVKSEDEDLFPITSFYDSGRKELSCSGCKIVYKKKEYERVILVWDTSKYWASLGGSEVENLSAMLRPRFVIWVRFPRESHGQRKLRLQSLGPRLLDTTEHTCTGKYYDFQSVI